MGGKSWTTNDNNYRINCNLLEKASLLIAAFVSPELLIFLTSFSVTENTLLSWQNLDLAKWRLQFYLNAATILTIKMVEADKLSLFFSNEFPFNKEGLQEFVSTFSVKSYKKGALILENGTIENELRFLDKGIIREYYASNEKEKNVNFYTNSSFITDFSSFTHSTATRKYQECLTDVDLRVLSKEMFSNFTNQYTCGKQFIETIFQRIVVTKETDEFNHFVNTAEELYLDIMKTKPDWLLQIPQYHIASYLGITPETLSRIRKRI